MLIELRYYLSSIFVLLLFSACEPPQIRYEISPPYPVLSEPHIPELEADTSNRRFLVFGDWGGGDKWRPGSIYRQHVVADGMAEMVTRRDRGVHYAISTGDNFYGKGVSSISDRKWRTIFEEVYDVDRFPHRFYAVLGNHDYGKNPLAQVAYHLLNTGSASGRWYMPDRYYTFSDTLSDQTTVQFFALDSQILLEEGWYKKYQKRTGESPGQSKKHLAWLEAQLSESKADWKIAMMHHPVYSNGRHGDTEWLKENVKPLFEKYGVQVVFSGHDHDLEVLKPVNGVHYFVSGAGANAHDVSWRENTVFAFADTGFMWCRLVRDELLVVLHDRKGDPVWAESVRRR